MSKVVEIVTMDRVIANEEKNLRNLRRWLSQTMDLKTRSTIKELMRLRMLTVKTLKKVKKKDTQV